ncbi:GSCFA domain-containing protein [Sulfitobacter sp. TSTF-M16]|uniref:GSCFA domain-containing protein n=2 Tax=Sulfitobacter aestuariivivens TaxID=2766981 RepID=A0A927HGC8_9RHOB|nr:GSCFA domain-containing protein [Sulfitobacter aestuariivivens]MBD3665378.1 GSCFA domain-containing protein [Sulfitobacter aestuariivivens]
MKTIPGPDAFSQTLKNDARKYPNREDERYDDFMFFPAIEPSFSIGRDETVFTIGSCFARNVEKFLLDHNVTVPTAHFEAPHEEAPGNPNRVLNQYNPGTMMQVVEAAGQTPDKRAIYGGLTGSVVDCLLATGGRAVSKSRAMERRQQISDLYGAGLGASQTVIITLGLIETWYDKQDELYLNEAPGVRFVRKNPDRFEFRQMGYEECSSVVNKMLQRLTDLGKKVVLTVSPVPLQVTFSGGDAVTRNAYSKSLLRVVAEQAATTFDNVDYFPSYEMVTTGGFRSFGNDNVHVRPIVVERIVRYMLDAYLR